MPRIMINLAEGRRRSGCVRRVAGLLMLAVALTVAACGSDSSSPTAASSIDDGAAPGSGIDGSHDSRAPEEGQQRQVRLPAMPPNGVQSVVSFPPRNEALAFRTDLEAYYRDRLRRPAQDSFVDAEGTIVWTQEYLRYRVNGCIHVDAVSRVLSQIDGLGIAPVCSAQETPFPPRNEPFAFRAELEAKYRDGLGRSGVATHVDVEGDIVWTQEYLRYRVSGCSHGEGSDKVFAQIDGRGVQPACVNYTGRWGGTFRIVGCTGSCSPGDIPPDALPLELVLTQSGTSVAGTMTSEGILTGPVTGVVTDTGVLMLNGSTSIEGVKVDLVEFNALATGDSMAGTFAIDLSVPGESVRLLCNLTMTRGGPARTTILSSSRTLLSYFR